MDEQERFPIMNTDWKSRQLKDDVPMQWVLNHESQCLTNHGQTARRLKERGGLSPKELYAVIHDMRYDAVKLSEDECRKAIKEMLMKHSELGVQTFRQYLERLSTIAQLSTEENFLAIQRVKADILNSYTAGDLSDFEKRTLHNVATIAMNNMRDDLRTCKEGDN